MKKKIIERNEAIIDALYAAKDASIQIEKQILAFNGEQRMSFKFALCKYLLAKMIIDTELDKKQAIQYLYELVSTKIKKDKGA